MPYSVQRRGTKYVVVGPSGVHGTHPTKTAANAQLRALYANSGKEAKKKRK